MHCYVGVERRIDRAGTQPVRNSKQAELPKRIATLAAVTLPVPKRSTTRTDMRLEAMVPQQMIMFTAPTHEMPAPSAGAITGHADPIAESGKPRLMKARYMMGSNPAGMIPPRIIRRTTEIV